jgi:stage II sporulation protein P
MPFALIYQTYTEDSYCKIQSDKDIAENRSNDLTKGVVKAGDTVYGVLKGNYKLNSIHNTDVFDANPAIAPTLSSAFASGVLKTIPNLSLLVDIDRDVVSNNNGVKYGPVVNFRDINYAPVLFTVICNQNTDIFYTNIKMALVLAEKFEYEVPGITRGIQIETDSRYDISGEIPTVMVKLGYDGNFVYDVNNTSEVFGKILGETYTK